VVLTCSVLVDFVQRTEQTESVAGLGFPRGVFSCSVFLEVSKDIMTEIIFFFFFFFFFVSHELIKSD
jgi:hypothetical protein